MYVLEPSGVLFSEKIPPSTNTATQEYAIPNEEQMQRIPAVRIFKLVWNLNLFTFCYSKIF